MYLTYLDESGSPGDLNTPFFVLAGVSVFERQTHWLEQNGFRCTDYEQNRNDDLLE
jgi:hypothetical protein